MLHLGDKVQISDGVRLRHRDQVDIHIGDLTKVWRGGEITGPVTIGSGVFINRDCYIRPGTVIGDNVNIGPFVRLVTDTHEIGTAKRRAGKVRHDPIVIGNGCWIGASVTILAGVVVGEGSVVAAGAVVAADVPENTLVAGVPARIVRSL
jgi:maltose O-acetyltransferase